MDAPGTRRGADRLEHVRGVLAAGAARGAGRHGQVAERHQQLLPFDAGKADVQVVGQAAIAERPVDVDALEIALQRREQPVAQRSESGALGAHPGPTDLGRGAETDDAGDVQGAGAKAVLVAAAVDLARQLDARLLLADEQRPRPLGTVVLVRR